MLDRFIQRVVRQRVLVVLILVVLAGWGVYSWRQIPLDAYPELTNNQVQVLTEVPGMSPVEVERLVTYPIETNMTSLPGVVENRSLSQFGLSVVTLVFEEDVDPYFARQVVFERLAQVRRELPPEAEASLAPLTTALGEVYQYALRDAPGDERTYSPRELRTMQDWILAPELRTVEGVVEANALGGFIKQYHVLFDPDQLLNYDLTIEEAYTALGESNQNVGGQYVERGGEQFVVRGVGMLGAGEASIMEDIRNTVITSRDGTPVLVEDVADVRVGDAVRHGSASMNGKGETVTGIVLMRRGANAQQVVNNVEERMATLKSALPPGVEVEVFYDRNELTGAAISTVTESLMIGGLLVILVLVVFLGDWRSALIVSLVLPMTALITFVMMNYAGFKANLMSLGGLAIGLGMFVDGAIVMVENVFRIREEHPRESIGLTVVRAGREVARPIAFAVTVVIAVFLPLFTLENLEGRMFRPMAYTVSFALLAALFLALTMAPALSSYLIPEKDPADETPGGNGEPGAERETGNLVVRTLKRIYRPLLRTAIAHRGWTLGAAALVLAGGIGLFATLGQEFAPQLEEGSVAVQVALEPSSSLTTSREVQGRVESALLEFPEVTSAISKTGRPAVATDPMGQNLTDMFVGLTPRDNWRFESKEALVEAMRTRVNQIPGATFAFTQPIALRLDEMVSGAKSEVAIKIFGSDLETLKSLSDRVAEVASQISGAADVLPSQVAGYGYLEVEISREDAARYGMSVAAIQRAIDMAVGGEVMTEALEGDRRFAVVGRFEERARNSAASIRDLPLTTPEGTKVRLGDVANVHLTQAPAEVSREEGKRKINVGVNVTGRDVGGFVTEARQRIQEAVSLPPGYFIEWGGQFESQQRANDRLMFILPITLAVVFVLLFMTFNSVSQAILVFLNIPVSLVGGALLLWVLGLYMSVPASVGFIAVLGIAVQNGIVMVSFIDEMRMQGTPLERAVETGAMLRLRPILMTTLTTLLGLMPLLFATGIGANLQRPLAAVVVGGLFTLVPSTLLLLPTLYGWFNPEADHTPTIERELREGVPQSARA